MAMAGVSAKRHLAMITTPKKRSRRSLLASTKAGGKVAVMSDYQEVNPQDVSQVTPPGKETEVLATVTPGDDILRVLLKEVEALKNQVGNHEAKLKNQECLLAPARAVIIRFLADYIFEACQYGFGKGLSQLLDTITSTGIPQELPLKHTIEGFHGKMMLTPEMAQNLKLAKPLTGKLSDGYCHSSTLKAVAECLTSPETAVILGDQQALQACKSVAEAMFGPMDQIIQSEDPKFNLAFTVPRYANHGSWKKRT